MAQEVERTRNLLWCEAALGSPQASPAPAGRGRIALAISGGGYRAMLYHAGAILRLNDAGLLAELEVVSSVSGGSITAGLLAHAWPSLRFETRVIGGAEMAVAVNLREAFVEPLMAFGAVEVDVASVLRSLLPGRSAAEQVARYYDEHLFRGRKLRELSLAAPLPGSTQRRMPHFVFNATNLQTGEQWQFRAGAMGGLVTGWTDPGELPLALAVAASSAFPPFLSPLPLRPGREADWHDCSDTILAGALKSHSLANEFHTGRTVDEPGPDGRPAVPAGMREEVVLTDGGVRDNLGLVSVVHINHRRTEAGLRELDVLVSDGGRSYEMSEDPFRNWLSQAYRVLGIATNEPDLLRIETLVLRGLTHSESADADRKALCGEEARQSVAERWSTWKKNVCLKGDAAYWSIERLPPLHQCRPRRPDERPGLEYHGYPHSYAEARVVRREDVRQAGRIETRLHALDDKRRERLVNWGYLSAHYALPYLQWLWKTPGDAQAGDRPGRFEQCNNETAEGPSTDRACRLPYASRGFLREDGEDAGARAGLLFPAHERCP